MRNRLMSLALIFIFVMSFCAIPSSGFSQEDAGAYELGVLKAIGVIGQEVNVSDTVSRANILGVMLKLANFGGSFDVSEAIYDDVPLTSSYASNVYAATELGIVSGSTDGNFYPENLLDAQAAVKMLVCIMGYEKKAEALGGYPGGYYSVANSIKLDVAGGEGLTMGELSVMIYSLLDVQTAEIKNVSSDGTVIYEKGKTLLEQMDMKLFEGIYCANAVANIYEGSAAGDGRIMVGDRIIYAENSYDELLGCYVNAYTRVDNNDKAHLLYMEAVDTDIVSYFYDEIINSSSVISDMVIEAQRDDDSKVKKYELESDVCILYNGVISDVFSNSIFELSSGSVTAVDNDGNKKYDVVKIEVSNDIVATSYSVISEIIMPKYGEGINISSDYVIDGFKIVDKKGNEVNPESIYEWDVVSAYYNKPEAYTDRKLIKIIVSNENISGTVASLSEDSAEIDNVEYKISPAFVSGGDLIDIEAGMKGVFFLNPNGDIFAIKADMLADINKKTGILIDAKDEVGLEETALVKIYDYTDEIVVYELADKVELDGERYETMECYSALAPRGKTTRQLIRYMLNSDNKVEYIDTAFMGPKEDDNTLKRIHSITDDTIRYRSGLKSFDGIYNVDLNSTKMFSQPDDINDDESYTSSVGSLTDDGIYSADIYITSNPFCSYAIVFNEAESRTLRETDMFLVTKVSRVFDELEKEVYRLSVLGQSTIREFYVEEDVFSKHNVEKGDIICLSAKNQNKVTDLLVIYDLSKDKFFSEENPAGTYAANQRVIMCSPYEKSGSWISLSCDDPSTVTDPRALESRNVDSYRKYVWDMEEEIGREATAADIADYTSAGTSCSKVFISEASAWPKMCIIYN